MLTATPYDQSLELVVQRKQLSRIQFLASIAFISGNFVCQMQSSVSTTGQLDSFGRTSTFSVLGLMSLCLSRFRDSLGGRGFLLL
jgi:hypothetical protein